MVICDQNLIQINYFLKFEHIFKILNTVNCDLLCVNETKLDDIFLSNNFQHKKYKLLRRDRVRNGGGEMILLKNFKQLRESRLAMEIVSFSL